MEQPTATPADNTTGENDNGRLDLVQSALAKDIAEEPAFSADATDNTNSTSEHTPLLTKHDAPGYGDESGPSSDIDSAPPSKFRIETSYKNEAKVIARSAGLLIPTFFLQYSLLLTTIISIGHLGTIELGAVSLGSMTANITGQALVSGLVTSLDTLCAQAYGAGRKKLVGLQVQRMVYFLWVVIAGVGVLWLFAPLVLRRVVPEPEIAELAGRYLRIYWFGLPGYVIYTAGQRFLRAQNNFSASLYIIAFVAPVNALLNWLLVWHLGLGFDGAPLATIISNHLLWISLVLYVYFVQGLECWPGFTRQALRNWGPMIRLSMSGVVMMEAEVLAFEILMLISSYFGAVKLAVNSLLFSVINVAFQIPFALSVAASTRTAHLIGGGSIAAARTSVKVAMVAASIVGLVSGVILGGLKDYVPRIFSSDPLVVKETAKLLPLAALFLLFDATGGCAGGILRGLGRQKAGAYIKLSGHYLIGMPLSLGLAFGAGWELFGLWEGLMLSLFCITVVEMIFIWTTSWQRIVEDAEGRNESD